MVQYKGMHNCFICCPASVRYSIFSRWAVRRKPPPPKKKKNNKKKQMKNKAMSEAEVFIIVEIGVLHLTESFEKTDTTNKIAK